MTAQRPAFVRDIDLFEGRRQKRPGLVEILLQLGIGRQHPFVGDGEIKHRRTPEIRRAQKIFAGCDLVAFGFELAGHRLVLLGHALVFGVPALRVVGLHPTRDFDDVGVGIVALDGHADLHLAAARQAGGRIENLLDFGRIGNLGCGLARDERHHRDACCRHLHQLSPVEISGS